MKEKRAKLKAKKKIRKRKASIKTGTTTFIRRTERKAKKEYNKEIK